MSDKILFNRVKKVISPSPPASTERKWDSAGKRGEYEMKKMIIIGVVVFAFALTANMAFASFSFPGCGGCPEPDPCPCPATNITQMNSGAINSFTKALSGTGDNTSSSLKGLASIWTGAATAGVNSSNQLGWNEANLSGVTTGTLNVNQNNNGAINSTAKAYALTGDNKASSFCGSAMVLTGAGTSGATSMNILGYNLVTK